MTTVREPRYEQTGFLNMRKQKRRSASVPLFSLMIVQSLFYLNPKFRASSYLQWLYSLVCVRPGNPEDRFSHNEAYCYLSDDPNEHHDISAKNPKIVEQLKQKLEDYKKDYVAPVHPPVDPKSNPSNWDGFWAPGWC